MNADNSRRLENIVRFGTIKTINPSKPIPRVTVNLGDIETPEIRCLNIRSGSDSTWDMPSTDEECVVISPCGDIGPTSFVMYGFYNDEHPAPSDDLNQKLRMFSDGCVIAYDVSTHHLSAILPDPGTATLTANGGVTVNAKGGVTVNANDGVTVNANDGGMTINVTSGGLDVNGDVRINGNASISETLDVLKKVTFKNTLEVDKYTRLGETVIGGPLTASDRIQSMNGDVIASGVSLKDHVHTGITMGNSNSGSPFQ